VTNVEPLDQHLIMRAGDPALVGQELLWYIAQAIEHAPRSQQVMIGPSEIGNPCRRRIAYKLLAMPSTQQSAPAWKATVGTSVHAFLADVFAGVEAETGVERFYVETELIIGEVAGELIKGTCDLYCRCMALVGDWKTTSNAKLIDYRRHGPTAQQIDQVHLYGRGWRRLGLPVDHVMLVFLPRDGELRDSYVWHAPYDDKIATAALERLAGIKQLVDTFGTAALSMLPTTEAYCLQCPYFKINSSRLDQGCPGDPAMLEPRPAAIRVKEGSA
jgi:hypothetical protein